MLFSEFIANYNGGHLDEILGRELQSVIEAIDYHGRKGTLNLALALKPSGAAKMDIVATYAAKPPIDNTVAGMMFVDKHKNLVADDPYQQKLELTLATPSTPKTILKTI